jgi:predicted ferric reductase
VIGASKDRLTFLVKAMGPDSWSQRLYDLAVKQAITGSHISCTLSVDGPVGVPYDFSKYQSVILVGMGIGVTPIAALWTSLRAHRLEGRLVHLVWIARDRALFQLMEEALAEAAKPATPCTTDSAQLFHSVQQQRQADGAPAVASVSTVSTAGADHGERKAAGDAEEKALSQALSGLITKGRPKWEELFKSLASKDPSRTLVFVCGPGPASQQLEVMANDKGWDFHTETFEL